MTPGHFFFFLESPAETKLGSYRARLAMKGIHLQGPLQILFLPYPWEAREAASTKSFALTEVLVVDRPSLLSLQQFPSTPNLFTCIVHAHGSCMEVDSIQARSHLSFLWEFCAEEITPWLSFL